MLWGSAKREQGPGLIGSQSEIKDVKVVPHVSAVCRSGERQHPELESETTCCSDRQFRSRMVAGELADFRKVGKKLDR